MSASVLILEDDSTLSAALVAFLKRRGVEALATSSCDEARSMLRGNRFKILIADCLLPGESGVDFVSSIRKEFPPTVLDIIFISGVFIDNQFIKENSRSSQAIGFLKKPFELDDLAPYLEKLSLQVEKTSPRKSLYQSFANAKATSREKKRLLESLEEMHGFDLPFIYRFLTESKISGHLNIVDAKNHVFGVTFASGTIVSVDLADADTFIGKLLIESGYILAEDLAEVLSVKSNKKMGERLIHSQLLSPHGFDIALANQMSLRLSRTIVDESVKVNFVSSEVEAVSPFVDEEILSRFIHDWIASKLTTEWLRAHLTPWGNCMVERGPEFKLDHPAMLAPLVSSIDSAIDKIVSGSSINEILESKEDPSDVLMRIIHFLFCSGLVVFKLKVTMKSAEDQQKQLRNMHMQFVGKNPVEIYDLMTRMTTASESEPGQVLTEVVLLMGAPPVDPKLLKVYSDIKKICESAAEGAKSGGHTKIKEEMGKQEIEKKLKAGQIFEQAKQLLEKSQYPQALNLLERVEKLDPKFDKIKLYLVWSRLGSIESHTNRAQTFKTVDTELMQIIPEEKFDAMYSFVMGMYYKAKDDYPQAKKNFEKAFAMDGNLIAARREMAAMVSAARNKGDVFNQDFWSKEIAL
jgi:response regulator of citrate/malate metabolism/tetratricopeptide (TPR) repeat protein